MLLTILFPCLNEANTIASCVDKACTFLNANAIDGEVLVVDNGSQDDTASIALAHHARVVPMPHVGYGNAIQEGIRQCNSDFIIMLDADGSYDIEDAKAILVQLQKGYELVIGNRFKGSMEEDAMPWLHRYIGNPLLSFLGRILYKSQIYDWHCGMRGFSTEAIKALNLKSDGMEFASEMILSAEKNSLRIIEVPIHYQKDKRLGPSHLRTYKDGLRHLKLLIKKKWS